MKELYLKPTAYIEEFKTVDVITTSINNISLMTILLTAVMDGNMKKQLLIISIIVVIVSIFVSCSVNKEGNIQLPSTTAVTDERHNALL